MTDQNSEELKAEADTFFRAKRYVDAIDKYTAVIDHSQSDVAVVAIATRKSRCLSNRAACREKLVATSYGTPKSKLIRQGLADGRDCIKVDPAFVRGYQRLTTFLLLSIEDLENTNGMMKDIEDDDDSDCDDVLTNNNDTTTTNNNDNNEGVVVTEEKEQEESSSRLTKLRREVEKVARCGLALDPTNPNETLLEALQVLRDLPSTTSSQEDDPFQLNLELTPTDRELSLVEGADRRSQTHKLAGGAAFQRNDWGTAETWYTKAIACDPMSKPVLEKKAAVVAPVVESESSCTSGCCGSENDPPPVVESKTVVEMKEGGTTAVLYSNRSATRAKRENFEVALQDADRCVELRPNWSKGHSRRATALFGLGRYVEAEQACVTGLTLESTSTPLKTFLKTCQQETCETLEVQQEMFRLRTQAKKDAQLQDLMAKLTGKSGSGGPQVFNTNNMDFSNGNNPFANLGSMGGGGSNGFDGLFGGGQSKKPKLSEGQMRSMARATCSVGTAGAAATMPSYTASGGGGGAKLEKKEEEVLTDDDDDDEEGMVGVKSIIE